MGLKERDVMVVGKGILFSQGRELFEGYKSKDEFDYSKLILSEPTFKPRNELGRDDKQIYSYVTFFNQGSGEVYTFSKEDGKIFLYIEGAVCFEDASKDSIRKWGNTLKAGAMREINKQIGVSERAVFYEVGYLNLDQKDYRDRFGILYFALTQSKDIVTHSRRTRVVPIRFDRKRSFSNLEELCKEDRLDLCSKAILEALQANRDYL